MKLTDNLVKRRAIHGNLNNLNTYGAMSSPLSKATFRIKKIKAEENAKNHPLTRRLISTLEGIPYEIVDEDMSERVTPSVDMGKETLRLLSYRGDFLKPCPGTRNYICCGYQILNLATNCPLDCSYCILQDYFNRPELRVFVNYHDQLPKVLEYVDKNPSRMFRIGTGEFTDSLALDPLIRWTDVIVPEFSRRRNAILELKTKTVHVENLLRMNHRDRIIVSWSLNSPHIWKTEEHKTPSIKKRLEAAARCQKEGFVLGFHFDPIVRYKGWQEGYLKTIELMDRYIDPRGIAWISLGSMRFMPTLKQVVMKRHPGTRIFFGEFIVGLDGKMRYFKPIRMELYAFMHEHLRSWYDDLGLYLCMESDEVWKKSMGWSPGTSQGLARYLDERVTPDRWKEYL